MSESFIFSHFKAGLRVIVLLVLSSAVVSLSLGEVFQQAQAQDPLAANGGSQHDSSENYDYQKSPFTDYAEFNQSQDEEADTRFFQFGRFFGLSIGVGLEQVMGNRGLLYQGGFPVFDVKLHYWFDFNFALDMGVFTAYHFYNTSVASVGGLVNVNILFAGLNLKYYIETKNLSSLISFASPFIEIGGGAYSKTQFYVNTSLTDNNVAAGGSLGAGLEFTLNPHRTFFQLEGKAHLVPYTDNNVTYFQSINIPNLTGIFLTLTANILFTY